MCTFVCVCTGMPLPLFSRFSLCLSLSLSLCISLGLFLCASLQNDFLQGLCALFWAERLFLRQRHCVQVRGTVSAFCRFLWGSRPSVQGCQMSHCSSTQCLSLQANTAPALIITSSTAQGGGGSFKNRKPIGELGCWITDGRAKPLMDRKVIDVSSLSLSFSLFLWLSTYLPTDLSIYMSFSLSISLSSVYLTT